MTNLIFGGLDFCIKNRGIILAHFSLFLPIKSSILMHDNCHKDADHEKNYKKILKMKLFENFGQNWANFDKKLHFLER